MNAEDELPRLFGRTSIRPCWGDVLDDAEVDNQRSFSTGENSSSVVARTGIM